ncbi:MAG: flagellar hook-basal body complex protein FliE [Alphaproteobacteria bacterium]|nr:flagellar hook-basal body complex protein FliE [Alphaproteobacteria bacterium]MCL2506027.1 flagellar hook-basal body complex protein FliE [Alphaproteobacteria bacterium]
MTINPLTAINAYAKNAEIFRNAELGISNTPRAISSDVQSFSAVVQNFMADAVTSVEAGEKIAASAVDGKADLTSIVLALDNAEIVLTQITAIRDKLVTAYQSVLNSPI